MKIRSCTSLLAAGILAAFAGIARGEEQAETRATIALKEVRAFPEAYRRVPFEVELLYHGPRNLYNPFFTVFEPGSYSNFAAWPGDAAIFRRDAYVDDHPFFYVDRKSEELQRGVMAMRPFTWFTARCIVRSVAQDRAWIEVLGLTATGATLDTSDLRHLVRASALSGNGEMERALVEIGLARLLQAPPRFVARCRLEEGRVALAANQPDRALAALQLAWPQLQDDKMLASLLDRASAQVALRREDEIASVPAKPEAKPEAKPVDVPVKPPAPDDAPSDPQPTTPPSGTDEGAAPTEDASEED